MNVGDVAAHDFRNLNVFDLVKLIAFAERPRIDFTQLGNGRVAPAFGEGRLGDVHEPGFEQALGQRLQFFVHPPVQLNLVVQRTQHGCNGALLGGSWNNNWNTAKNLLVK